MLKLIKEVLGRIFYIIPQNPKTAQISITNKCNFNCPMCQRHDLKVLIKQMDFDFFKKILVGLNSVEDVILTGWGEPLLHPDLLKMIQVAKEKGKKVRFTSNAALLTEEKQKQLLISGVDEVSFSVESIKPKADYQGHDSRQQIKNIKQFADLLAKNKSETKINLQTVLMKDNLNDLMDIAEFAKENKVDRLRLTRLDIRFHDFDHPDLKSEKKAIKKLEKKLKNSSVGLDFVPHTAFSGWQKILYKLVKPFLHRFGHYCLRTFNDVYINVNGQVTPCCGLPKLVIGNLVEQDLKDIWQSKKFQKFRKNQKIYCGKCDILSLRPHKD